MTLHTAALTVATIATCAAPLSTVVGLIASAALGVAAGVERGWGW